MTTLSAQSLSRQDARLPVHQRVAAVIHEAVCSGALVPGDVLPGEAQLARDFDVALGTIRHAMETLRESGLVERQQGRGTFIRQPDFSASMLRFFRFGDRGVRPTGRVLQVGSEPADDDTARALGRRRGTPMITLRRLRAVDDSPVVWERIWLPGNLFGAVSGVAPLDIPQLLYPWYQERFGILVARASEELTFGEANHDDVELLGCPDGAPIVVIERVALSLDGTPLERRISRGLASTFRYRVEIS